MPAALEGYVRIVLDESAPMLVLLRQAAARDRAGYVRLLLAAEGMTGTKIARESPTLSRRGEARSCSHRMGHASVVATPRRSSEPRSAAAWTGHNGHGVTGLAGLLALHDGMRVVIERG